MYRHSTGKSSKPSSSNWVNITEASLKKYGNEKCYNTKESKLDFQPDSDDIEKILGYKNPRKSWGGGDATLYMQSELKTASIKKHGEEHYYTNTKAGKEMKR